MKITVNEEKKSRHEDLKWRKPVFFLKKPAYRVSVKEISEMPKEAETMKNKTKMMFWTACCFVLFIYQ